MADVRRSGRVLARLNVLIASDTASHNAITAVVNREGALILSPVSYPLDAVLEVRNMKTGQAVGARVVWEGGPDQSGLHKIGIELMGDMPEFWGVDYPVMPPAPPQKTS